MALQFSGAGGAMVGAAGVAVVGAVVGGAGSTLVGGAILRAAFGTEYSGTAQLVPGINVTDKDVKAIRTAIAESSKSSKDTQCSSNKSSNTEI